MKIAISTETAADLSAELLQQYEIKTVPFGITLGDEQLIDGEFSTHVLFDYVAKSKILPKTNAVNEYQYTEHFSKLLEENDAIIHISLSSKLSSACENALKTSKKFKNVFVIDSLSLSTGIGLLAIAASELKAQGKSAQEIVETLEKRKLSLQVSFVLETLEYLYRGGRCSGLVLFGANLLKLRPQILVNDGKMTPAKKYRGKMEACVEKYCEDTLAQFNHPDKTHIFLTHSRAEEAQIAAARAVLERNGFKNIHETIAGATISSHCGKNCLGILYFNDSDETL